MWSVTHSTTLLEKGNTAKDPHRTNVFLLPNQMPKSETKK